MVETVTSPPQVAAVDSIPSNLPNDFFINNNNQQKPRGGEFLEHIINNDKAINREVVKSPSKQVALTKRDRVTLQPRKSTQQPTVHKESRKFRFPNEDSLLYSHSSAASPRVKKFDEMGKSEQAFLMRQEEEKFFLSAQFTRKKPTPVTKPNLKSSKVNYNEYDYDVIEPMLNDNDENMLKLKSSWKYNKQQNMKKLKSSNESKATKALKTSPYTQSVRSNRASEIRRAVAAAKYAFHNSPYSSSSSSMDTKDLRPPTHHRQRSSLKSVQEKLISQTPMGYLVHHGGKFVNAGVERPPAAVNTRAFIVLGGSRDVKISADTQSYVKEIKAAFLQKGMKSLVDSSSPSDGEDLESFDERLLVSRGRDATTLSTSSGVKSAPEDLQSHQGLRKSLFENLY